MTFAMLTRLSPDVSHAPSSLRALERSVVHRIETECPTVRWIANYATLGEYHYLDIFEAPTVEVALQVTLLVGAYGQAQTQIWPILGWGRFKQLFPPHHVESGSHGTESTSPSLVSAAVDYLQQRRVEFELHYGQGNHETGPLGDVDSAPRPEAAPTTVAVASHEPARLRTRLVNIQGSPALLVVLDGQTARPRSLAAALGIPVTPANSAHLRGFFTHSPEPIPPLGGLVGVPVYMDAQVATRDRVSFSVFSPTARMTMRLHDLVQLEAPKILPFAESEPAVLVRPSATPPPS